MRRLKAWLSGILILWTCAVCAGPTPKWRVPECRHRLVFRVARDGGTHVLLTVPAAETGGAKAPVYAFGSDGAPCPTRIVHEGPEQAAVLCELRAERRTGYGALYYGAASNPPAALPSDPSLAAVADPTPVYAAVRRTSSASAPNTWPKMLYLYENSSRFMDRDYRTGLGAVALSGDGREHHRQTARSIVLLRTALLCPEDGAYRFGLRADNNAFLLVDGELAASRVGEADARRWRSGGPISLKAGLHRLEVYAYASRQLTVHAGWRPPGRDDMDTIPASRFICASEPVDGRFERIDRTLHPAFTWQLEEAFRIAGLPRVFVPVRFRQLTANWLPSRAEHRWSWADGREDEGDSVLHVFGDARPQPVTMTVRDSMGFTASLRQTVDCSRVLPVEHVLSAGIEALPAVCFPPDPVEPELVLRGELPGSVELDAQWTVVPRAGERETHSRRFRLTGRPVSVPLVRAAAGELDRIRWEVRYSNVIVTEGAVRFLSAPFAEVPARASGNRLFSASGSQLVLVPEKIHSGPLSPPPGSSRIVLVDELLDVPGLPRPRHVVPFHRRLPQFMDGRPPPRLEHLPLPAGETAHGEWEPLTRLVRLANAVERDASAVVLCLGLQDILERRDVALFERYAAAMTDLLAATGRIPVVWVTPPPYPPDPARIRPFAAAIHRVAASRGVRVADLFTAGMGKGDSRATLFWHRDLGLTQEGQDLAAALDYPADRKDVQLLLEEDDAGDARGRRPLRLPAGHSA
jgi:hypothetical protein